MNAVMTAEYVVLEQTDPNTFQQEINAYAQQGYKVMNSTSFFDDSNRAVLYNAVMIREPAPTYLTEWQARMTQWEEAFQKWGGNSTEFSQALANLSIELGTLKSKVEAINHRLDGIEKDVNGTAGLSHNLALLEERIEDIEAKIDWWK